ncbi:macro domain-containing protein [Mycobacterium sp. HUMS_1102779]|uniref:hypothetical protein n=1 Tax=Mycobacterium sp. HUMS_1102779 TaxID=3383487 RepID=UPI0038998C0F
MPRGDEPMIDVQVLQAEVTKLDIDAIANAAHIGLPHGGGVAAATVRPGWTRGAARVDRGGADGAARRHRARSLEKVVFAVHGEAAERAFSTAVQA